MLRSMPPFRKTWCAVACISPSTSSISFLPLIAVRRSDSSTGRRDCACSKEKVRVGIGRTSNSKSFLHAHVGCEREQTSCLGPLTGHDLGFAIEAYVRRL